MTFLEAVNAVLRRLREDSVTASSANQYSKLIGDFVNQAIYDTEHAWDWNCLKETIDITTVASQQDYAFSTTDVKIIVGVNDTANWYMRKTTDFQQAGEDFLTTTSTGSPYFYSFLGKSGTSSKIRLQPTPTGVESIKFLVVKHTDEKALDGTDDSDELTIPSLPIVLSAYARAVSERGEDGGIGVNEANREASSALADAIAMDAGMNHPEKVSWHAI